MFIELNNAETIGLAALFLVLGHIVKDRVPLLERFFIPAPIIGGLIFSLIIFAGHQANAFDVALDSTLKDLLLVMFFTTIGFTASLEMLKKGGIAVALFLLSCTLLVLLQNAVGVSLASALGTHPLIGLATGSVSLTGGHGTSAAFGPLLQEKGAQGALPAAIAAATWGLVAGSMIGGPVGLRLMRKHNISGPSENNPELQDGVPEANNSHKSNSIQKTKQDKTQNTLTEKQEAPILSSLQRTAEQTPISVKAIMMVCIAMGVGGAIIGYVREHGITVPAYLGAMLVAAIIRNVMDLRKDIYPKEEMESISMISLSFFLVLALMEMRLWELFKIAGPVLIILIVQTVIVFVFASYVTFRVMGKNYDAVTLSVGHCGVGLGATPNAMANIQTFTKNNGPSPKAFFVIPIVGSLFIDFVNSIVITVFINVFS